MSQPHDDIAFLRYNLNAMRLELAFVRARMALKTKYSADKPRVPSGSPDGGQWTSGDGSPLSIVTNVVTSILGTAESFLQSILVAGGFTKNQMNMPVQDFVSNYCLGSINREIPSQFFSSTIESVKKLANLGDAAAVKCLKILNQDRFRK